MVTTTTLALQSPRPSADPLVFTARRLRAEQLAILSGVRDSETGRFEAAGLPRARALRAQPARCDQGAGDHRTDGQGARRARPCDPKFRMLSSALPADPKPKICRRGTLGVKTRLFLLPAPVPRTPCVVGVSYWSVAGLIPPGRAGSGLADTSLSLVQVTGNTLSEPKRSAEDGSER